MVVRRPALSGHRRALGALVALVTAAGLLGGSANAAGSGQGPRPGAPGVGDDYYPLAGNGGYDVRNYGLRLSYDPASKHLRGSARIKARATQALSRFNLDLLGLRVHRVVVDGHPASYRRHGQELVITPASPLRRGERFVTTVRYSGTPQPLHDPLFPEIEYGWIPTEDGSFVANEPDGAPTWYPVSDHPTDKATYWFRVTVPRGLVAVANGLLMDKRKRPHRTTWVWRALDPTASYLSTVTIGKFRLRSRETRSGLPIIDAIHPSLLDEARRSLRFTDRQLALFTQLFGPYPFEAYGAIVDDADIGYALETQTRPIYDRNSLHEFTVAHEMAHMWYGDSVSPGRWQDIWLNEGFATYAEWLWAQARFGQPARQSYRETYRDIPANDPFWELPPGDPQPENLFDGAVYVRGAMTLGALRERVGYRDFFTILRAWARLHQGGTATTPDLVRLAERVSGRELSRFFDVWLYRSGKPAPRWAGLRGDGSAATSPGERTVTRVPARSR